MVKPIEFKGQRISDDKWLRGVLIKSVNNRYYIIVYATEDVINTLNEVDFAYDEVKYESISMCKD